MNEVVINHFLQKGRVTVNLLSDKGVDFGFLFMNSSKIEAIGKYIVFYK